MLNRNAVFVGLFYSMVGIFIGILVSLFMPSKDYNLFPVTAGLSAFLTVSILWRLIQGVNKVINIYKGIAIGVLSGIISHYFCWLFLALILTLRDLFFTNIDSGNSNQFLSLELIVFGSFTMSLYSLIVVGWLTISTGALIVGMYSWYLKRKGMHS